MPPNATKDTLMLKDIPDGIDPGEVLDDEHLAKLYKRELAKLKKNSPERDAMYAKYRHYRRSAALTADAVAEAGEDAEDALAAEG